MSWVIMVLDAQILISDPIRILFAFITQMISIAHVVVVDLY